jgi:hypothetical protein
LCVTKVDAAKQYIDASIYLSQLYKGIFNFYIIRRRRAKVALGLVLSSFASS